MKKFLAIGAGLVLAMQVYALTPQLKINGETVEKALTSLTFDGDNIIVHFGSESETHDMEDVVVTFTDFTGVADFEIMQLTTAVKGDIITIEGASEGTIAEIFDVNGLRRVSAPLSEATASTVDISSLRSGIYLLRVGNKCVKFVKH